MNIDNKNDKGEYHGYVELYWANTNYRYPLWLRGNYKNGKPIAYVEAHEITKTNFYIRYNKF